MTTPDQHGRHATDPHGGPGPTEELRTGAPGAPTPSDPEQPSDDPRSSGPSAPTPADPAPTDPSRRPRARGGVGRALLALLAALASAAGVVGLARLAVGTASGQRLDQLILSGAQSHEGRTTALAEIAVGSVSVPVVAAVLGAAVLLILLRRRGGLVVPLAALVVGANVTTQVVKHLVVDREVLGPGIEITPNSFPSGHTALAASAAVVLVLAAGRSRWLLAPLAAVWTAAAGIGTLVVGWHRPSDVVGSILIVAAWTFLVLAVDGLHSRGRRGRLLRDPGRGRRRRGEPDPSGLPRTPGIDVVVAVLLALAGLAALALAALTASGLELPLELEDTAQQEVAYVATSALIAGGTAIWLALVLVLRGPQVRQGRRPRRVP